MQEEHSNIDRRNDGSYEIYHRDLVGIQIFAHCIVLPDLAVGSHEPNSENPSTYNRHR